LGIPDFGAVAFALGDALAFAAGFFSSAEASALGGGATRAALAGFSAASL
jgi:hypothetical protein